MTTMKKNIIYKVMIAVLLVVASVPLTAQQKIYKGQIGVSSVELKRQNNRLHVSMQLDMGQLQVDRERALTLTPVLSEGTHRVELPFILVNGTSKHKAYARAMAIDRDMAGLELPYSVLRAGRDTKEVLDYSVDVPYESWMHGADLGIVEDLCGCGGHVQEIGEESLIVPLPYVMQPTVVYMQPREELVKLRNERKEVKLDFPVGKIKIYPDYMGNWAELSDIESFLDEIRKDKNVEVTRVDITGYASPEGTLAHNEWLASERAKALKTYLVSRISLPESIYRVKSGEENWDGLLKLLRTSNMPGKDEVVALIKNVKDINVRKKELKSFDNGIPYRQMLTEYYPKLRKVECFVTYRVRNLSVEEGKELLETNPRYLSLDEMYRIANSYPVGSEDFQKVFEIAVRTYPDDPVANLNAAAVALYRKDMPLAKMYLDKADKGAPEYSNDLGVYYMLTGELDKAKVELTKARQEGVSVASDNLLEIEKKLNNDR